MIDALMHNIITIAHKRQQGVKIWQHRQSLAYKQVALILLGILLLSSSLLFYQQQQEAFAAHLNPENTCSWYKVHWGDTLSGIAARVGTNIRTLARANSIWNINLIFAERWLCIPHYAYRRGVFPAARDALPGIRGVLANGYVRWYAYDALEWSTRSEVTYWLRRAAAYYGLPAHLLLAIAWQESKWNQHIIAPDGGIGVMQIMPSTAMTINIATGLRRDPYKLIDNIYMGASYVRDLWFLFHGNLSQIISAYNEGGWAVRHYGIYNWGYVNGVLSMMRS